MSIRKSRTNGIERAFQILECMVELGSSATAYQIAKHIHAPLSTIYETIALLERLEVLQRYGTDGKFFLGSRLLIYGLSYTRHMEADEVCRREADALCKLSGENVQLCFRDGDMMVVGAVMEGVDSFRMSPRAGSRIPLTWAGSGNLLLGHLSPEERGELFARAKPSSSGRALTDAAELEERCRAAWERGYCVQQVESDFAVSTVAAPIKNPQGECFATICLVVPKSKADEKSEEYAKLAIASARTIERQLGWQNLPWVRHKDKEEPTARARPVVHSETA